MSCTYFGFNVNNDKNDKLRKVIEEVAGTDNIKQLIMAGYTYDDEFINYCKKIPGIIKNVSNIADIAKDKLKKAFEDFYNERNFTIKNNLSDRVTKSTEGFSSEEAKMDALNYCADQIIITHYANINKLTDKKDKTKHSTILAEVERDITKKFNESYFNPLLAGLNNVEDDNIKEYKEVVPKYEDNEKKIEELNEIVKNTKNKKAIKAIKDEIKERKKDRVVYESKILKLKITISNKYGNEQTKNFANLVRLLNTADKYRWESSIFLSSKLITLVKDYKNTLEHEKSENPEGDIGEEDIVNPNAESVDLMSKSWEDKLAASFDKMIDADIRLYLDTIPQLTSPDKLSVQNDKNQTSNSQEWSYATNNTLGVAYSMGGKFILHQLLNTVVVNSPQETYNAIYKLAHSNPNFYGIAIIADRMANDMEFAKRLTAQLSSPKVNKVIATINSDGTINVGKSNKTSDPLGYIIFNLMNQIKDSYYSAFSINDETDIKEISDFINSSNIKNDSDIIKHPSLGRYEAHLIRIFSKYFPNVDTNDIISYLYRNNKYYSGDKKTENEIKKLNTEFGANPRLNSFRALVKDLQNIIDIAKTKNIEYNKKINEYKENFKNYKRDINDVNRVGKLPDAPVLDISSIDLSKFNSYIIGLSKKLQNYSTVKNELNTVNAENNLASDIIKNNYIMNMLKQIRYGNENDSNAGLERLKEFVTKGTQYRYSPFFFGVYTKDGKKVTDGLFIRNGEEVLINPNAKQLIDVALFDGTKDTVNNTGITYSKMTKGDYFLTKLFAYYSFTKSGENIAVDDREMKETYGNFFLRTPADAPKNFLLQCQKFSINETNNTLELFGNAIADENKYMENFRNKVFGFNETIPDDKREKIHEWFNKKNLETAKIQFIDEEEFIKELNQESYDEISTVNGYCKKLQGDTYVMAKFYRRTYKENNEDKHESIAIWFKGTQPAGSNKLVNAKVISIEDSNNGQVINDFINRNRKTIIKNGVESGEIRKVTNHNNGIFLALRQHLLNEMNNYVGQLRNVFVPILDKETNKVAWVTREDTKGLFDLAHTKKGKIVNNGRLAGNFFSFHKLFEVNGYNPAAELERMLYLYGGGNVVFNGYNGNNDRLVLNTENADFIDMSNNQFNLVITERLNSIIDEVVENFINNFVKEIENEVKEYETILEDKTIYGDDITASMIQEFALNDVIMNITFDDIFTGDTAFYKSARDMFKREKEVQAGGISYANFDMNDKLGVPIQNCKDFNGNEYEIKVNGISVRPYDKNGNKRQPLKARNGFRAVTIQNTVRSSMMAPIIKDELLAIGVDEKVANEIAKGFMEKSKVNDAQSYITLEEFISRKEADGTLSQYADLLQQIFDVRAGKKTIGEIDLKGIAQRIQVQKNFYYDIAYDDITRTFYPRQIKNAEFVLIPELIQGTELGKLYDIMNKYDIGQVNTVETTKAAKRNILTFWDDEGTVHADEFEAAIIADNQAVIEDYYYRYLYKQQDVPQHMVDEHNKAGIQIIKKILDNADMSIEEIKDMADGFFNAYCANIKHSFNLLMQDLGWKQNSDGKITNIDGKPITFDQFYNKAIREAQRLGLNSNLLEYLQPGALGDPTMPNFMNNVSSKLESIAQSIFNSSVTRQKLPGWHGAQVTSVGHGVKVRGEDGKYRDLRYHPRVYKINGSEISEEQYNNLSEEDKAKATVVNEAYMEIMIPRWSNLIPKGKTEEEREEILRQIEKGELDIQIGYRIPTEGKQSISICKVVGFLDDIYGSTVMVPDEWVAQTGSDFDVDSIYAICYEFYRDRFTGEFKKVEYDYREDEILYGEYINRLITEDLDYELVTDEEKKSLIVDIKKSIKDELGVEELKEKWDKALRKSSRLLDTLFDILGEDMGLMFKKELIEVNKKYPGSENLQIRTTEFAKIAQNHINDKEYSEVKDVLQEMVDVYEKIVQIDVEQKMNSDAFKGKFEDIADEKFKEIFEKAKFSRYHKAVEIANKLNLVSFEEFKNWTIDEKQSQRARNNKILDSMVGIMKHPSSREENYSRSKYTNLLDAMHKNDIYRIGGDIILQKGYQDAHVEINGDNGEIVRVVNGKEIRESFAVTGADSTYNPFTQIKYMDNAMSGAKLKAFSVTRDTFNSINNFVKSELSDERAIVVRYKNNERTNVNNAIAAYGNDVIMFDKTGRVTYDAAQCESFAVKHKKLTNSNNNRNVVNELITVYGSETTAHILDAVKEGSIFNENDYTFSAFKTTIDVGIDYETAIALLMQPGVSEIVKANNENNSIYITNNSKPVNLAINRVAARLNIKDKKGKPAINDYTKLKTTLKLLSTNKEFREASLTLFGVDVASDNNQNILNIGLDAEMLQKRLQQAVLHKNILKQYADIAFDIYTIRLFNSIMDTGNIIGNLARCSNPDTFGAKQTINATRKVLEDIKGYSISNRIIPTIEDYVKYGQNQDNTRSVAELEKEYHELYDNVLYEQKKYEDGANTILVNGKPLMQALYPGVTKDNIRIEDSAYPYMASFLKYATEVSVNTNKKLFTLESDEFSKILDSVQKQIGTVLSDEQYKEYKQYIVSNSYNSIHFLVTPTTINLQTSIITNDIERIEQNKKRNERYWDYERSRILGFDVSESASFEISDVNNPTEAEISRFNRLTPAQKVIWIKSHISDNKGIFGFLNTNTFNQFEFKVKGFSGHTIQFNDQIDNIEEVFRAFRYSFYHSNPLIRLAAIDLIKYAYINEGFKFKRSSVSKLIPNDVMYSVHEDLGLDIINNDAIDPDTKAFYGIKKSFNNIKHSSEEASPEFVEKFIRSHSEIVKEVKLPNRKSSGSAITNRFFANMSSTDGLVFLNKKTEEHLDLINYLDLNNSTSLRKYIRITSTNQNKTKTTTLYRIERHSNNIYLVPLNLLERNETSEYSANRLNNKFFTKSYFDYTIGATNSIYDAKGSASYGQTITEINTHYESLFKQLKDQSTVKPHKADSVDEISVNREYLKQSINSLSRVRADEVRKFLSDINIQLGGSFTNTKAYTHIMNNSSFLARTIDGDTAAIQEVDINGVPTLVAIQKDTIKNNLTSKRFKNALRYKDVNINSLPIDENEKNILRKCEELNLKYPIIYRVTKLNEQDLNKIKEEDDDSFKKYKKAIAEAEKEQQELASDEYVRNSSINLIVGNDNTTNTNSSTTQFNDVDRIAKEMYVDIERQQRIFERELYDDFVTPEEENRVLEKVDSLRRVSNHFMKTVRMLGVDMTSSSSIHENTGAIFKNAVDYYKTIANVYVNKFNKFIKIDGEYVSIADERLYDYLKDNPDVYNELVQLLLEAKNFGNVIQQIFDTQIIVRRENETEDLELRENAEKIKQAINLVRNNALVGNAFKLLFNKYFAEEYSTNPLLKKDKYFGEALAELRDSFGDIDWLDLQLSDVGELRHNQIQTVAKYIYSALGAATRIIAPKNVEAFEENWNKIIKKGNINLDHIITKQGKLVNPANKHFNEDKQRYIDELNDIEEKLGRFSKEYVHKRLEFEKWKLRNTEQELVDDYYEEIIDNLERVLDVAEDYYLEYNKLRSEYYINNNNLSEEEESNRRKNVTRRISNLRSLYNEDGTPKSKEEQQKVKALNAFINEHKKINNTYYDDVNKLEFTNNLIKYTTFIRNYDEQHKDKPFSEKLKYSPYKEAYDWLEENAIYDISPEHRAKIKQAYEDLSDSNNPYDTTIKDIIKSENAYDEYGRINPLLISDEALQRIKDYIESKNTEYPSHIKFIKDKPIIDQEFYTDLFGDGELYEGIKNAKINFAKEINNILAKGYVNGEFNVGTFLANVTKDELYDLSNAIQEFNEIGKRDDLDFNEFEDKARKVIDNDTFNEMLAQARLYDQSVRDGKFEIWLRIFAATNKNGEFIRPSQVINGKRVINKTGYVGSYDLFGYLAPNNNKYINKKKTNARKFLKENVEYVPSKYYRDAEIMAKRAEFDNPGAYKEWYDKNHIYNERTMRYEPIKIWMEQHVKDDNKMNASYSYIPTGDNVMHTPKVNARNKKYSRISDNFKNTADARYHNSEYAQLTNEELELYNLIRSTLRTYASNYKTSKFIEQGFLPRRAKVDIDKDYIIKQIAGSVGLNFGNDFNNSWTDNDRMNYANDRDADFDMLKLLRTKGTKEVPEYPKRDKRDTDESYKKKIEEWKKAKEEIEAENLKLDNSILDRDWLNVMKDFISRATEYNTKQRLKNTAYIVLEDLKQNKAYKVSNMTKRTLRNRKLSTDEDQIYQSTNQNNAYEIWQNWIRRVFFNEFKKDNSINKFANLLQNMTSAKYMIFNVTGGIANVGTGMSNIFNEVFAREYFDIKTIHKAKARYVKNSLRFIADWGKEKGSSRDSAIVKLFDVVDLDAMMERKPNETIANYTKRINELLYSMQSAGEHYMQNCILFAMLESHRKYTKDGKVTYGTFADYSREIEKETMYKLLESNSNYIEDYKDFFESIKDPKKAKDYLEYKKDINQEFIRFIREKYNDNDFGKKYYEERNKALKSAKETFNTFETLDSQIVYDEKTHNIKFKEGSGVNERIFGEIRQRVIQVNKRIHGVYDKIGAARIESEWYGGLVMQYHKHIYPGFMKRFRIRGTYNEIRGTIEKGSYVSLWNLLTMEFNNKTIARNDNNQIMAIQSLQNLVKNAFVTIMNIKSNYNTLPIWEQRNLGRVLGDLCGIAAAILIAFAIYGMTDDDDEKESETVATGLYVADRLLAEAQLYTPWGIVSEAKTLWSSSVAAQNGPGDLIKGIKLISDWAFDDEFDPVYSTGRYQGENKFLTLIYRNIPGERVYQRLSHMTKNNSYYRLNDKEINMKFAKGLADDIFPDR